MSAKLVSTELLDFLGAVKKVQETKAKPEELPNTESKTEADLMSLLIDTTAKELAKLIFESITHGSVGRGFGNNQFDNTGRGFGNNQFDNTGRGFGNNQFDNTGRGQNQLNNTGGSGTTGI